MVTGMPKKLLGFNQIMPLCRIRKNLQKIAIEDKAYVPLFHGVIDLKQFYKVSTLYFRVCVSVCVCVCVFVCTHMCSS